MSRLAKRLEVTERAWDDCASTYETQIVQGHPDIVAYERFEEDFLDRVLTHLAVQEGPRPIKLLDLGCGSGRLHLRYGAKTTPIRAADQPLAALKAADQALAFDPRLAPALGEVFGLDFSAQMITLAKTKMIECGLSELDHLRLTFEKGSAFDLSAESDEFLPVAVCLINTIGVMQGPAGAVELLKAMRRSVEDAGGIAIVSCYQREYVPSHGLGQYESTLDVSGQPVWLVPDRYAGPEFRLKPKNYSSAHNPYESHVAVFDSAGTLVKEDFTLERDPERVKQTIDTGHIQTHSDYDSNWYAFEQLGDWTRELWSQKSKHFETKRLDALRAEPGQIAIVDFGGHLDDLFARWKIG